MELKLQLALLAICFIVVAVAFWLFVWPFLHRRQLDSRAFPADWGQILADRLTIYKRMNGQQRERLERLIVRFLDSKRFVGCAGLMITDEIRVTVAAHACLLLLNQKGSEYASLRSILVYPASFWVEHDIHDESGLVSSRRDVLSGESWSNGRIVLAWDDVERGIRDFSDGHNVVLHEFAHQLDHDSGITNGAPVLSSNNAYRNWARVFSDEFARLQEASAAHRQTLIDEYGATDPAEFFAVATETFYEKPHQMAEHHAELYAELSRYYGVDPREWQTGGL